MSQITPSKWNIFESEIDFDCRFFEGTPFRSRNFKLVTILLCLDFGVGGSTLLAFWSAMPSMVKTCYLLTMIGLLVAWFRMHADHRKMRTWLATTPRDQSDSYAVGMASHLMTFVPLYLNFLVLILLFCVAGFLRREARLSAHMNSQSGGTTITAGSSFATHP
jgi:hypothetical protein